MKNMKSMKEIYNRLKRDFKKLEINFDEKREVIEINNCGYEISASSSMVELSRGLRYINHRSPKNYNEIYKYTKKYITDPEGYFSKLRKQRIVALAVAIIFTILIGLLLDII